MAQSPAEQVASSFMARRRLSIVGQERRYVLCRGPLCRAGVGVWRRLRLRLAVGSLAAVRRPVNRVRLQVAEELLLTG